MFDFEKEVYLRMFKEFGEDPINAIKKLSHKDYMRFVDSIFDSAKIGIDFNIALKILGAMNGWRCEDDLHHDFSSDDRVKISSVRNSRRELE